MLSLVMRGRVMKQGPKMVAHSMMGPYNRLPREDNGIGFTFYYYHKFMSGLPGTKLCAVNGVLPSTETVRSGQYPLVTEVYLVHREGLSPDNSPAGRLVGWLLSEEGQVVVAQSGYVPLNVSPTAEE